MRFLFAVLLLCLTRSVQAQSNYLDGNAEAIEAFLDRNFRDTNAGMVIGLIDEHGTRVFSRGKLDSGTDASIDGDTIFEMASVTKVFTSLLLVDAVHRGEMNLRDPVAKYMPENVKIPSYRGKEITLLNLAVQDSGLPWNTPKQEEVLQFKSGKPDLEAFKKEASKFTVDDLHELLSTYELTQEPGEKFQYSNVGMALLGNAIERATGRDYESLVVERICRPLGMHDSLISLAEEQRSRLAHGHMPDGAKADFWSFQAMKPAGALLTTANDMLKFLSANLGLTETDLTPLMKQTQVNRHSGSKQFGRTAMPWFDNGVYNPPGTDLLGHSGGGAGTVAFIAFDAKNRRGVVVLTNQMEVNANPVGWTLIQGMPFTRQNTVYAVRQQIGVGVWLKKNDPESDLHIIKVFPDSPAGEAGLTDEMVITQIGETPVEGKGMEECIALMSGEVDTIVRLKLRGADGSERTVDLSRRSFLTNS